MRRVALFSGLGTNTNEFTPRGSGPVGINWDPIPYSWPHARTRSRRRVRQPKHWKLLSSINGRVDIYLGKARTEAPAHGPAGWLAGNLGLFAKQTEQYSVREFLSKYTKFLTAIHHTTILLAEIDYDEVYVGNPNEGAVDLADALSRIYEQLSSHEKGNKVLLSTLGRTDNSRGNGLEVTTEAQYNKKHGQGKPGIEVRILAIPSILLKNPQESDKKYRARMKRLLKGLGDAGKAKFAMRYENTAKILLKLYDQQLRKVFDVAKTSRWLHVEWGKTGEPPTRRTKL